MMQTHINHRLKFIEIWLTSDEAIPPQYILDSLCEKNPGYKTVIFQSGKEDLVSSTIPLLKHNLQ